MQDPSLEPDYSRDPTANSPEDPASTTVSGTLPQTGNGETGSNPDATAEAVGHTALQNAEDIAADSPLPRSDSSRKPGDVTAILEELELKRRLSETPSDANSSADQSETAAAETGSAPSREKSVQRNSRVNTADASAGTVQGSGQAHAKNRKNSTAPQTRNGKRKKKKKKQKITLVGILKTFLPWRGDSLLESVRKIIFCSALAVVGVCTFLISNYYLMLYRSGKEYEEIQRRLAETQNNRGFQEDSYISDPVTGTVIEYLEQNEIADLLLSQNPDLVGYITIDGTEVSYPVVQKKSADINVNMNDYYLYRSFKQESSKAGCIFLDYRCHFDEVVNHRRIVENSDNLVIYGHNMNNRSMFGSLKDYIRNYSYYAQHPIVHLQSLYKSYDYKIFAVFLVDSEDMDSEYAFDCWNTLNFNSEDEFYNYVNEAKKRTIISNEVDVTYGDPLLMLYTCNTTVANGKLILMCRLLRPGEDPAEGTENSGLNSNALYPLSYYRNHTMNYDPALFVPYGPSED